MSTNELSRRGKSASKLGVLVGIAFVASLGAHALAWDAHGHRAISYVALDLLPDDMPAWMREGQWTHVIADQAAVPDRWRSTRTDTMSAENGPNHYLDVDLLPQFGLTLETMPRLRGDYIRAMIDAKREHPDRVKPYDRAGDTSGQYEFPGFALQAIDEEYQRLRSAFNTLRVLEGLNDPARAHQIETTRANIIVSMGNLSHYIGDLAQPLHTTMHHHGWVGENPGGYTTENGFHSYIDGRIVDFHAIGYTEIRAVSEARSNGDVLGAGTPKPGVWTGVVAHVAESFGTVEQLYKYEKSGELREAVGREFILSRLSSGAEMLAWVYQRAWEESEPTDADVSGFLRFDGGDVYKLPTLGGGE